VPQKKNGCQQETIFPGSSDSACKQIPMRLQYAEITVVRITLPFSNPAILTLLVVSSNVRAPDMPSPYQE